MLSDPTMDYIVQTVSFSRNSPDKIYLTVIREHVNKQWQVFISLIFWLLV